MTGSAFLGDVFIISQLASKVGCAFANSQAGSPDECTEVDRQLKSLTAALECLADLLEDDTNSLSSADDTTQAGVSKVLVSCRRTLQELDSYMLRARDVQTPSCEPHAANQKPERSWKRKVTSNWKNVWGTTQGEHNKSLRDILQLHARSVSPMPQAVQRWVCSNHRVAFDDLRCCSMLRPQPSCSC